MNTDKDLANLLQYSSPKILYIVNNKGKLQRITCPFRVFVLQDIGNLQETEIHVVDVVKVTNELITVYLIRGKLYFYFYFEII